MKEKKSGHTKEIKTGCQRYFQMFLYLGLSGSKLNLWTKNITSLIDLLVTFEFVPQLILEKTLYNLIVEDRGKLISLNDFDGQLERDLRGMPYWNVYLQTSALTTSRCIQEYKKHGLVDESYKIISKGKTYSTKELTSKAISEGFIVYEKLCL